MTPRVQAIPNSSDPDPPFVRSNNQFYVWIDQGVDQQAALDWLERFKAYRDHPRTQRRTRLLLTAIPTPGSRLARWAMGEGFWPVAYLLENNALSTRRASRLGEWMFRALRLLATGSPGPVEARLQPGQQPRDVVVPITRGLRAVCQRHGPLRPTQLDQIVEWAARARDVCHDADSLAGVQAYWIVQMVLFHADLAPRHYHRLWSGWRKDNPHDLVRLLDHQEKVSPDELASWIEQAGSPSEALLAELTQFKLFLCHPRFNRWMCEADFPRALEQALQLHPLEERLPLWKQLARVDPRRGAEVFLGDHCPLPPPPSELSSQLMGQLPPDLQKRFLRKRARVRP